MAKMLETISMMDILPPNLRADEKVAAAARAIDDELQRVNADIEQVIHLARIDKLPEAVVDLLAWQFHVDFYEPVSMDLETKRRLVKQSIAWHRIKGTPAAVEQVLSAAFSDAVVTEWFEYGGEPYHFRIKASGFTPQSKTVKDLLRALDTVKNVRSWLDGITIDVDPKHLPMEIYVGLAQGRFGRKKIGLPRPDNVTVHPYVGMVCARFGRVSIKRLPYPPEPLMKAFYGMATIRTGRIRIPGIK